MLKENRFEQGFFQELPQTKPQEQEIGIFSDKKFIRSRKVEPDKQYYKDINMEKYSPLTPEEEKELLNRLVKENNEERKKEMKRELSERNLRLVINIAKRYREKSNGMNVEFKDVVQEGNVGLLEAVERFNTSRGVRLNTYAYPYIKGHIRNYLASLERKKRKPDLPVISINEHVDYKYKEDVKKEKDFTRIMNDIEDKDEIEKLLSLLTPGQKEVVSKHFGIGGPIYTLREIAGFMGISETMVYEIENKAIIKLQRLQRTKKQDNS